ncbi:MAG: MnhB domain-containing protein [Chloroflexia bacterium]|nr:MnhB domain-containing protein [Chloroflexia bacterium]
MTTELHKIAARILLLPALLVALGVMVKGYSDPGDGFSAGVIAALAIALQLMVFGPGELDRLPLIRYAPYAVFLGLIISLLTAFVPSVMGQTLFTHWPPAGDSATVFGTLEFITAVAFDVGVFLIVFGFGVGVLSSFARAEARIRTSEERAARSDKDNSGKREAGNTT